MDVPSYTSFRAQVNCPLTRGSGFVWMCEITLRDCSVYYFIYLFIYLSFLGPYPWHMEVARLGFEMELQLPASLCHSHTTATRDPSGVWDLHWSSRQCQILNPLNKARGQTCILMDASRICFCWATTGTPSVCDFKYSITAWQRTPGGA